MWFLSSRKSKPTAKKSVRRVSFRPCVEGLEERALMTAGVLDPTFGSGGVVNNSVTADAVLIQPNNDIVVVGYTNVVVKKTTESMISLSRYTPSGTLDTTFGSGGSEVTSIAGGAGEAAAINATTGQIVVTTGSEIVRFNANGSIDTTFGSKGVATVSWSSIQGVVIQANGQIVVSGDFHLTRFNSNGTVDTSFGTNGTATLGNLGGGSALQYGSLALQSNGELVMAGTYGALSPGLHWVVAEFTTNGTLDTTFDSTGPNPGIVTTYFGGEQYPNLGEGYVHDLAIYPNAGSDSADYGKIVALGAGYFSSPHTYFVGLARYNANGTPDTTFGQSGVVLTSVSSSLDESPMGAAIQADGKIVVAANTSLQRYNTNGTLDTTFGNGGVVTSGPAAGAVAVAIDNGGNIVTANPLARYLAGQPIIGSFTNSGPVTAGNPVTLSASNITDANPNSTITQVAFYLDSNGDGVLDSGDTLLGYGTNVGGVWSLSFTPSTSGTFTLFAVATDSFGVTGTVASGTLQVN